MRCGTCSRDNVAGSLFCQECGKRLGNWSPQDEALAASAGLATPPTGIERAAVVGVPPIVGPTTTPQQASPLHAAVAGVHAALAVSSAAASASPSGWPSPGLVPPVGASAGAPVAVGVDIVRCPRCSVDNPRGMRFCKDCGLRLGDPSLAGVAAPAPVESPAAAPVAAPALSLPTVCWRCRGVGDSGAEFCKFCGARYADGTTTPSAPELPPQHVPESQPAPVRVSAPSAGAAPVPGNAIGILVSILKDGTDGRTFPLYDEQTDLGRTEGQLLFADDPYLSPRHARLRRRGDAFLLRDLDSVNGTYVRIRDPVDLSDGDMILMGQQVLRFELLSDGELPLGPAMEHGVLIFGTPEVPRIARLVQLTTEGVGRDVHYLYRDETVLGRENGDIVFTDDPFLSRRHAAVTVERGNKRFTLRDLGSSNGTSIRFRGERVIAIGDQFRVGRHLFRIDRPGAGVEGGRSAR